ncbi:hypothetical protein [Actinocrispum sp. NPDC049592]|uniref:hypothetical protein n=1 Tax=Actinocrispum sp. NPDC049592 TaxID=3154835 RepID=UPI00342D994B
MTREDAIVELVGFVAWGPEGGLSEAQEPAWLPTSTDTYMQPPTYAASKLRVLPDGSPQLTLRNSAGARVVRLGSPPVQVAGEFVRDAVMTPDGNVVLLDQLDIYRFDIRCVTADGTVLWGHAHVRKPSDHGGVRYDSRLLIDSLGRVFVAISGSLIQVDESASTVVAHYPGGHAVMCPDGRIGYARAQANQTGYWVVRDIGTAEETATEVALGERDLRDVVGADAAGRVYWRGQQAIARMVPGGGFDWLVDIGGITVSERYGVSILTYEQDRGVARFDNGDRVPVADGGMGRLVGRGDDGEYVLHRLVWTGRYKKPDARLTYVDRDGRVLRTEAAPDEMWLTMDIAQPPDFSSVTADGAVLVAVSSELGVHVVRVAPGGAS